MLNLSDNKIGDKICKDNLRSFGMVYSYNWSKIALKLLLISAALFFVLIFLPWTQNITAKGLVTTLQPNQRPQNVTTTIGGKIEEWFVREGDFVKKGDTILFLSEIKDQYFDPNLLDRTEAQIKSKELSVASYMDKVKALDEQIDALLKTKNLKIQQAENYIMQAELTIQSDSIDLTAAINDLEISEKQYNRTKQLYEEGLKSLSDLEEKSRKLQESKAKKISTENKLLESRNKLINAQVELVSVENQYKEKLSKAESSKFTALSNMYDAEAVVTKMQNQYMNYSMRRGMYFVRAPQDGYITQTIKSGIGEIIKEGESLLTIMPAVYDLAVSVYIDPMDLPLISKGQEVRFMFDGWPAIAFSGWPNLSYGTFGGEVVAIDNFTNTNGKYRLLVAPSEEWPDGLRVGSGAQAFALLKDVPIWYELWRRLNGFPPDFYQDNTNKKVEKKKK